MDDQEFEVAEWRIVGWILDPTDKYCTLHAGCTRQPSVLLSHWESLDYDLSCEDHVPKGLHDPIAELLLKAAEKLPMPGN